MTRAASLYVAAAILLASVAEPAQADTRPTSDALSVLSGRTVGNGEVVLSGALGWRGFWVDVLLAPSSRLNIAIRAHVDYGAFLGFDTALGGGLSLPIRWLIFAKGRMDIALSLRPFVLFGEGAMIGEQGAFADDLGYMLGTDLGVRAGASFGRTTVFFGAGGTASWSDVPNAAGSQNPLGAVFGILGADAVMSRATTLFIALQAGYGFAPSNRFASPAHLRLSIGMSYRL